jgi:hypothetical protein
MKLTAFGAILVLACAVLPAQQTQEPVAHGSISRRIVPEFTGVPVALYRLHLRS